jgi:hypothetical protein
MKKLLLMLLVSLPTLGLAGNGSTGGGNIYGNQLNPWFLTNTKSVTYCVEIAPEFSRLSRPRVLEVISSAFSYWKEAFANYQSNFSHDFEIDTRVGNQTFNYVEHCSDAIDIKFQLGFLTDQQLLQFPNHKQILGLAHRTHYDEVNLKGKGFIYLAPEEGKLRPLAARMHATPWSFGNNFSLKYALIHELGHVFGLQDDHYSDSGLMSAMFIELITSKEAVRHAQRMNEKEIASPFGCDKHFSGIMEFEAHRSIVTTTTTQVEVGNGLSNSADPRTKLEQILNLPKRYKFNYHSEAGKVNIKINRRDWGVIDLNFNNYSDSGFSDPAITLYLTRKQKVFTKVPRDYYHTHFDLYHLNKSYVRKDEVLKLKNGKELKVFINYDQQCRPTIGTVLEGELFLDIFRGL